MDGRGGKRRSVSRLTKPSIIIPLWVWRVNFFTMRIVIVGGVAGGMSAATRLRRLNEKAEIIVLERSGYVSFANCGLPYYLGGVIQERDDLLLQTPQSLAARFAIDVRVGHEVTKINPSARPVTVQRLASGEIEELNYDALVLSTGARPNALPVPGFDRALTVRTVEDIDQIKTLAGQANSAVVIGGGFIGLEMVENLVHLGLQVALVEATEQVMAPMDIEMVGPVHDLLREQGVDLHLSACVEEITDQSVVLETGEELPAEVVISAIGVVPDSAVAKAAGLTLGPREAVMVDDYFRTSAPDIYAVGDVVAKVDALSDEPVLVPLANTANLQGRRVADVIMGRELADRPVLGTSIVGVFGLQVAATGWSEKRLRAAGRPVRVIHTHPADHAGYYPGAKQMALKLLVDPETDAILGAQGVGESGIDKRIDVIATAISGGLLASELNELELAYAPQFGMGKDPVNMLGYIAANLRDGLTQAIQWHEVDDAVAAGAKILDVRSPEEFEAGRLNGAVLIPLDELRARIAEVPQGDVIVHCFMGMRGYLASRILAEHGIASRNVDGGLLTWQASPAGRA